MYNNYNYINVTNKKFDLYEFEEVKRNTSLKNININKTSSSYTQARKKLLDSESSSSSILISHVDKISKQYYIKNNYLQRFSPKLVPYDNRISKINYKKQDSKPILLTNSSSAWGLRLKKKSCDSTWGSIVNKYKINSLKPSATFQRGSISSRITLLFQ